MADKRISKKTLALVEKEEFFSGETLKKKRITQTELQDWFRKKHKILIEPCYLKFACNGADGYYCRIFKKDDSCHTREFYCHIAKTKKYKKALERGLREAFTLI